METLIFQFIKLIIYFVIDINRAGNFYYLRKSINPVCALCLTFEVKVVYQQPMMTSSEMLQNAYILFAFISFKTIMCFDDHFSSISIPFSASRLI